MAIFFLIDVTNAFLSKTTRAERNIREVPAIVGGSEESRHGIGLAYKYINRYNRCK